ncbi:MAG TPA: hypothetical protein VFX37_04235 [Pseudolabrys sp.]|nr:hypothetical protein [Pseudolabrys sp.]
MKLVERREPIFESRAHDSRAPTVEAVGIGPLKSASRVTRVVTGAQMLSTLLAVPLGLASGYSIYRANFSPDTTCQNLRAGIIAMLDKSVDAATRHILVRHDVETFEHTCGSVDPDATAAFKRLLAVDRIKPVPGVEHAQAKAQQPDARQAEAKPAHKAEAPAAPAKPLPPKTASKAHETVRAVAPHAEAQRVETARRKAAAAEPAQADAAPVSDVAWLSAVRDALVKKNGDAEEALAITKADPPHLLVAPPTSVAAPTAPVAPVLPQARTIPAPAQPPVPAAVAQESGPDHPVPPAPVVAPPTDTTAPKRGGIGGFISDIPFVGPVVDAVSGR